MVVVRPPLRGTLVGALHQAARNPSARAEGFPVLHLDAPAGAPPKEGGLLQALACDSK